MRVVDLLRAVRDRAPLPAAALQHFIAEVAAERVPTYQTAAFLMAVCTRGLSEELVVALTLAMRDSGRRIDLSAVAGIKVDKHSTGGVGDKISLPLAPLVAACGVPVPMVSGRALGHTGGTLDKLESIPGFTTAVSDAFFADTVGRLGLCMMGQTASLAPADKILYALRDVTATVESIPLITSSILAKKLAEGIDALLLDVKVGRGAFMKDLAEARTLAQTLVRVGQSAGLRVRAVLTRMDQPLGRTIGNALEMREAIAILHGQGPADSTALTLRLAAEMLILADKAADLATAQAMAQAALDSGAARALFAKLIAAQGGDAAVIDDPDRLPTAAHKTPVLAPSSGYVRDLDAYTLAQVAMRLGAGRTRADAPIDPAVGLELCVQMGDRVAAGQPLAVVHHNVPFVAMLAHTLDEVCAAMPVGRSAPTLQPQIIEQLGD